MSNIPFAQQRALLQERRANKTFQRWRHAARECVAGSRDVPEFSFMLVADDYALSPAVSRGIREALAAGRLSGTGAMTNRPSWQVAARELEAAGFSARAGLHLNLTCGEPLTRCPDLAPAGTFPALKPILAGARRSSLPQAELVAEIGAQLDAFAAALGRPPAYVDGHQHVHMLPQIREILFDALSKRGWQSSLWLRDSADNPVAILRRRVEITKAMAVAVLGRDFGAMARAAGFAVNAGFAGFSAFAPSGDYGSDFARYLIAPGERHLVMCHPGYADEELARVDPNTLSRENELRFLLSSAFPLTIARADAELLPV